MKTGNSKTNKVLNRNTVLKMLALNAPVSRIELSKITGLTKMSLTNIISEFMDKGYVKEIGLDLSAAGKRKPILLELNDGAIKSIGINITRTYTEGCLFDIKGKVISREKVTYDFITKEELEKIILNLVEYFIKNNPDVLGIGVSAVGPIDSENGIILNPTNFYGIENVKITELLKSRFDVPVYLRKNTVCSVLAEKYYGTAKNEQNFAVINITHGVGCCGVVNGRILTGKNGHACEIGHLSIDLNGEKCACGNRGCLEIYANIPSAVKFYSNLLGKSSGNHDFSEVTEGYLKGEKNAVETINNMAKYVAAGIINAINIFDPETVILSGPVCSLGEKFLEKVKGNVGTVPIPSSRDTAKILFSSFGDDASLIGSAVLVFENEIYL